MVCVKWLLLSLSLLLLACGGDGNGNGAAGGGSGAGGDAAGGANATTGGAGATAGGGAGGGGGGGEAGAGGQPPPGWRSALYPDDWTPAYVSPQGHRIHDFSYAGYHNGEAPIGTPTVSTSFDVVDYGADPSGQNDSTAAVQQAIDAAAASGGGVIAFPNGDYRFDGTLVINANNIVLRGNGATQSRLFFTKSANMSYKSHIRFEGNLSYGPDLPLAEDGHNYSRDVLVADAGTLAAGHDIAIGWNITPAFIADHGMTNVWQAFNDTWQPFFYRKVIAVDTSVSPHKITVDVPLRYDAQVKNLASVRTVTGYLRECGVDALGLANAVAWDDAWQHNQVHVLEMRGVVDSWVRAVASFDPPTAPTSGNGSSDHLQSGGILIRFSKRVTVANSTMERAEHKGGGGNGYLFELRQSSEVLFRDCKARQGRHNFVQNWGFGVTGCVWQRVDSREGEAWFGKNVTLPQLGYSEFHHSLATANLIDQSRFDDGFSVVNRGNYSSGAGHTGTATVIWNTSGSGNVRSRQYDMGFVVGTGAAINIITSLIAPNANGTAPEDWVEGAGIGATLYPPSLYDDQLAKRLAR